MPLRKHFVLRVGKKHYVNDMAWHQLRKAAIFARLLVPVIDAGAKEYMDAKQMYVDARMEMPLNTTRRPVMPSWRREIPIIATALHNAGKVVDLRVFHSRKHARPSHSKLHAVRSIA